MRSAIFVLILTTAAAFAQTTATVPVTLDHNRIIIDVYLPLPDGTQKRIRGWVDNGNADLWLSERAAKLLQLQPTPDGKETNILGAKARPVSVPREVMVGGMKIALTGVKAATMLSADSIAPGSSAEINLPSTVLRNYDVVADFTTRELTLSPPGQTKFTGKSAKAFINSANGLIQLPAKIAGQPYQLTLDLGACFSMLAGDTFQNLAEANPKWPRHTGAIATELFWGMDEEAKTQALRVPSVEYGPMELTSVGFVELPQAFIDSYRQRAGAQTSGLIGSNALLNFRVGLDYAHSTVYFDQRSTYNPPGLDVVGLTLRPELDGRYTVIGVPEYDGKPAVPDVKPGDVLVSIDKVPAAGATMGQIWSLLGGSPGDIRVLTLKRDGQTFTAGAAVRRFLPTVGKP